MDELPEVPFEKVLSYLSLEDRLRSRAVSRRWYWKINCFKVQSLCYSERPAGCIFGKGAWPRNEFPKNFIFSTRAESFFNTFGQSVLFNLQHLRLNLFGINRDKLIVFCKVIHSFDRLEELVIDDPDYLALQIRSFMNSNRLTDLILDLPMLKGIRLYSLVLHKLILDTPKLQRVHLMDCYLELEIVHAESVETMIVDTKFVTVALEQLKSLKYLHVAYLSEECHLRINPTLLSGLEQLKEIHLNDRESLSEFFEQKRRYGRTGLKIYLRGLLLNGFNDLQDLQVNFAHDPEVNFVHLTTENLSRLADEIRLSYTLLYETIEQVGPAINLVKRCTFLQRLIVNEPVQDIKRFLNILKNHANIEALVFRSAQPQDLLDQLPEHSAIQCLEIRYAPADFRFLLRLKYLIILYLDFSIDTELIQKLLEELEFLIRFKFKFVDKAFKIEDRSLSWWSKKRLVLPC